MYRARHRYVTAQTGVTTLAYEPFPILRFGKLYASSSDRCEFYTSAERARKKKHVCESFGTKYYIATILTTCSCSARKFAFHRRNVWNPVLANGNNSQKPWISQSSSHPRNRL